MYFCYIDKVLVPIAPSKLQININNQNKTINLINDGEVNIVKAPGLSTIKLDLLLPLITKYPFAKYKDNKFQPAAYYLEHFERLKAQKSNFQFIVSRWLNIPGVQKKQSIMKTNMTVTLEEYSITEDSDNAPDIVVSLLLKQYVSYGTVIKEINTVTKTVTATKVLSNNTKSIPNTYKVVKGDTLWSIAKKLLGDGAKCWNLAKLNKISNPNKIHIGQILIIQDVKGTTAPDNSNTKTVKSTVGVGRKSVINATPSGTSGAGRTSSAQWGSSGGAGRSSSYGAGEGRTISYGTGSGRNSVI